MASSAVLICIIVVAVVVDDDLLFAVVPQVCGNFCVGSLFYIVVLSVLSSLSNILLWKGELVALLNP